LQSTLVGRALSARLGRTLGLACLAGGMALYESVSTRTVLDRWSVPFFAALVLVMVATGVSAGLGWRGSRAHARFTAGQALFDGGIAAWGIAYLLAALDDRLQGGRLLDANFFGSIATGPAILEWFAMVLFTTALLAWAYRTTGRAWANMLLSAGAVVITVLLAEGAARLWTLTTASTHMGYASRVWQRRFVTLNHDGARDVEHALLPASSRRRLLVVGDSYAFGWGVPRIEDRFGEQLAMHFAAGDGTPWESLNVSEPDKHTLHELEFLKRGLRFRPDMVVLLYVFNDMDYLAPITPRPMLLEAPNGIAGRLHPTRLLFTNSYFFQEMFARVQAASRGRSATTNPPFMVYEDSTLVRRHLEDLRRFVAIADSVRVAAAIVPVDMAASVDPATLRRYESFVSAAQAGGLPVVSISHAFDGYPIRSITVGSLDGHPNALGHRIAAAAAAPELMRRWKTHSASHGGDRTSEASSVVHARGSSLTAGRSELVTVANAPAKPITGARQK
jgi:lysophospholipase L1-like esterase